MPHLAINGKELYYEYSALEPTRRSLVFVHGAGCNRSFWSFQQDLAAQYNLITLELPGHGDAAGPGEKEIAAYSAIVRALFEQLTIPQPCLVGHSMGGAIVMHLAISPPPGLQGIILVATGARLRVLPAILEGLRTDFKPTIRRICEAAIEQGCPAYVVQKCVHSMLACDPEVVHGDFLACDRCDLRSQLSQIKLPTLIIAGEHDQLCPPKYSHYLAAEIANSQLIIIPQAGHMLMIEQPQAVNQAIDSWLSNFPSAQS